MRDLADLLGQSIVLDELLERFADPGSKVCLQGPSGSGKSSIANNLAELLNSTGIVVRISGDAGHSGTKFLALHRALANTRMSKSVRDAMKKSITSPLRLIPVAGGAAAGLANIAVAGLGATPPEFLTAEQQDLLQGLQNLATRGQLYLFIDDVGHLDQDTAQLISNLALPEIRKAYPFAENVSILIIETLGADFSLDQTLIRELRVANPIKLDRPSKLIFPSVLRAFGLKRELSAELLDALFAVSQGHLEIAKQIVRIDKEGELQDLVRADDATELMTELLRSRISGTDNEEDLQRLLAIAACAGSAFPEEELRCAFMDDGGFAAAFETAIRDRLLSVDGDVVRFVHEVIRKSAVLIGSPDAETLHGKLAECVKLLRPGDYYSRFRHLALAGDGGEDELNFALAMQNVRGERDSPILASDLGEYASLLDDMVEAYRLTDEGQHREAIAKVMPHYDGGFGLVQGEIVVLIALNQIKRRSQDSYSEAVGLLEHWREWHEEPELWQRLMSCLVAAQICLGDTEAAGRLYTKLARNLMSQSKYDPYARNRAEALNRKADMVFTSEIAIKHISRAVEWFGPGEGGSTPRNAFEYTSSLVNLSGAQFTLGRFELAARSASDAVQWIDVLGSRGLRTAEAYKALNNYVIAALRAGLETPESAGQALDLLLSKEERSWYDDRTLVGINRGALGLLADQTGNARDLLEKIWLHINDDDLDGYYALYSASNLAVARSLTDERDAAMDLLESVEGYLESIPRWFRSAHKRRLELLAEAIEDHSIATAESFDLYPGQMRKAQGDQDPWWSIGRGLIFSDIQVWSEG